MFKIKYKDRKTKARVGEIVARGKKIKTPFFMPVATKGAVKYINSIRLKEIGVRAVISNAFILSIGPGVELISKLGGIGKFMNFNGVNFSDSGGFQMYSDSLYIKSSERGVWFKNPVSGEKIFMTPEENMKLQFKVGADVVMCLDSMPIHKNSKREISNAVNRTLIWAERCKKEHDRLQSKLKRSEHRLLFCISQGGIYKDLREKCSKELLKLDFDGYAIGGVALPESCYRGDINKIKKLEHDVIKVHKKIIPENKPVYLMGEGDPVWLLKAIELGCDCFDSRYPTQAGRRGTLLTSQGKLKILNKKYAYDKKPIDLKCDCFVCQKYSRAYVRHLLREGEAVGKELASYHNLYYLLRLMEGAQDAIRDGEFEGFEREVGRVYG